MELRGSVSVEMLKPGKVLGRCSTVRRGRSVLLCFAVSENTVE